MVARAPVAVVRPVEQHGFAGPMATRMIVRPRGFRLHSSRVRQPAPKRPIEDSEDAAKEKAEDERYANRGSYDNKDLGPSPQEL